MEDAKNQLSEKLQAATNILVTVSTNPSVDQLAACLGLTLWLNKLGKHATAVFSGNIPNALEFLQPEATIEKTTDSLRDFIIALDKSKADKLRYKVEDRVVKIFITPYRTSLSANDLEFSQGDFNVDAIVALGVTAQEDLDNAIVSHGRILHDAVVTSINTNQAGGLGSVNWHEPTASSLSELAYELCQSLDPNQLDPQIATALLTGIVAETSRFSNNKTTPHTMSISAALMAAGANQQLIATKLDEAQKKQEPAHIEQVQENPEESKPLVEPKEEKPKPKPEDGTLEIEHSANEPKPEETHEETNDETATYPELETVPEAEPEVETELPVQSMPVQSETQESEPQLAEEPQSEVVFQPELPEQSDVEPSSHVHSNQSIVSEPPSTGGTFTANTMPEEEFEASQENPLNLPPVDSGLLDRKPLQPTPEPEPLETPEPQMPTVAIDETPSAFDVPAPELTQTVAHLDVPTEQPPAGPAHEEEAKPEDDQTLTDIEQAVASPHLEDIRDQVQDALKSGPLPEPGPVQALNAVNVDLQPKQETAPENPLAFNPAHFEVEKHGVEDDDDPDAPPQVPPPIVPPDFLPPAPPKTV